MVDDKPSGSAPPDAHNTAAGSEVPDLLVDWSTEPPALYVTGAHATYTPRECAMLFEESAPFPGRRAEPGAAGGNRSRLVASLRVSPEAYFKIVCALASNWYRFAVERIQPDAPQPPVTTIPRPVVGI